MEKLNESCTIGKLKSLECHKKTFIHTISVKLMSEFDIETRQTILLRCDISEENVSLTEDSTICAHHEMMYTTLLTRSER
jgi:hypothetical protein